MSSGDREKIDERIEVPQPVLDRCRCQHQNEFEAARRESLSEALCDLGRGRYPVEVSELVRFVEDQHLEAAGR